MLLMLPVGIECVRQTNQHLRALYCIASYVFLDDVPEPNNQMKNYPAIRQYFCLCL